MPAAQRAATQPQPPPLVKVALVGDSGVGKTSLMVRYVEGTFDETQLPTQGVNFMERTVSVQGHKLTFSVWDIGGSHFESMLPLVCNDAAVVLLMFDLCRRESLDSIRKWHEKARSFNKHAVPFLVGCKWDQLALLPKEEHRHVEDMARRFAKAIKAPLIFCAPSVPINVTNVFKVTPPAPECTAPPLHRHAPSPTPPAPSAGDFDTALRAAVRCAAARRDRAAPPALRAGRRPIGDRERPETRTSARASLTAVSAVHAVPGRAPKRPGVAWERWDVDVESVLYKVDAFSLVGCVVELSLNIRCVIFVRILVNLALLLITVYG
jgi:GTP-binding protein of the ras superfamily involved in termination of M-phase